MGEQTQFPIGLFDLAVGARRPDRLEPQNVVKGGRGALAHADDGALLVGGVGAAAAAVVVLLARFGVGRVARVCARGLA